MLFLANHSPDVGLAFNSLSRDHLIVLCHLVARRSSSFQLPLSGSLTLGLAEPFKPQRLSTPSLGITRAPTDIVSQLARTFNSLSRDHISHTAHSRDSSGGSTFQLPLSGSHSVVRLKLIQKAVKAFNSLSRDHFTIYEFGLLSAAEYDFQLPLSGSRVRNWRLDR